MNLIRIQSTLQTIASNRALLLVVGVGVLTLVQTAQIRSPQSLFGPFIDESKFASTYVTDVASKNP